MSKRKGPPCPTPWKNTYPTDRAALGGAISAAVDLGGVWFRYPCVCGAWHLTNRGKVGGETR